jgi:hypothetical protein
MVESVGADGVNECDEEGDEGLEDLAEQDGDGCRVDLVA